MNVILAHGFLGFNVFGPIAYFNGVKEIIEKNFGPSVRVFVPQVPLAAGIEERAARLSEQIQNAFAGGLLDSTRKAHIIAHSMGGLDARCMISKNLGAIAARIATLTTIGTPHRGSQIADLIMSKINGENLTHNDCIREELLRTAIAVLGIPLDGLRDLTTGEAGTFDGKYPDREGVQYFYIAGKGRDGLFPTCGPFLFAHKYIKECTGDAEANDGLVSVSSASRGGQKTEIWPADHADEIGHNIDILHLRMQQVHFDHLKEYCRIVERLSMI